MLKTNNLNIDNGIFQGDSISLFSIDLIPLSIELKNIDYGYKTMNKKNKNQWNKTTSSLYAKNDNDLEGLQSTVKRFSGRQHRCNLVWRNV